ncbi:hypothetical protein Ait01nite_026300 [Actinoplanes italicus]|uniref:Uncharacterized protein n=1 Tax=Actinoplanes italicus TaxID=113567 RepID=A0A2T0KF43_9ACTN|nr:hypothetical protein [Actinoplanes italicus]PRX21996.1 hypothetical protein CLV67_105173 [Actinoplanes italicus]GIE29585.1 hypothetical protein Ait01nite_026300 [Actinoplanes italicus]
MSPSRRDDYLILFYLFLLLTCVAGLVVALFAGLRPYGLIAAGAAITTFLAVMGVDSWFEVAREDRTGVNMVLAFALVLAIELLTMGGLAALHAPWRPVGFRLLPAGAVLLVAVFAARYLRTPTVEEPPTPEVETAEAVPVKDPEKEAADRFDEKVGLVVLPFLIAGVVCVCVPSWRDGALIAMAIGASILWWAACGGLVIGCWQVRKAGPRTVARWAGLAVAVAAAPVAALLPAALARMWPEMPGGRWGGVAAGMAAFVVLVAVKMVMTPTPAAPRIEPSPEPTPPPPPVYQAPQVVELSFSSRAERGIQLAVAEMSAGQQLTTGRLLAALVRADPLLSWERVWLHTGGFDPVRLAGAPDRADETGDTPTWRGVPVSGRLEYSMRVARRIGDRYRLRSGSTGVLTLALLAERGNGATEVLLGSGELSHAALLSRIQLEILEMTLDNLRAIIPAAEN